MKQVYHSNATTNVRLRNEINKSKLCNSSLSLKYGVSEKDYTKNRKKRKDLRIELHVLTLLNTR